MRKGKSASKPWGIHRMPARLARVLTMVLQVASATLLPICMYNTLDFLTSAQYYSLIIFAEVPFTMPSATTKVLLNEVSCVYN